MNVDNFSTRQSTYERPITAVVQSSLSKLTSPEYTRVHNDEEEFKFIYHLFQSHPPDETELKRSETRSSTRVTTRSLKCGQVSNLRNEKGSKS